MRKLEEAWTGKEIPTPIGQDLRRMERSGVLAALTPCRIRSLLLR
jgi:hypothetical protein